MLGVTECLDLGFLLAFLIVGQAAGQTAAETQAALVDRERIPVTEWPFTYYLSTGHLPPESRSDLETALRFVVPNTSRAAVLDEQIPVRVNETLWRIDTRGLQWSATAFQKIIASSPYNVQYPAAPLVTRADWLVVELSDAAESDSYYVLLFGSKPKTRDEALKLLNVSGDKSLSFGMIEGKSGVSAQRGERKQRWIESRASLRGYAWGTRDVFEVKKGADPLDALDGDFKHDGEEWLIGIPKVHLASGTRCTSQIGFLANGQGGIVDKAPVDLVRDHTLFRGYSEIRAPGSCYACHGKGMNTPTINEFRDFVRSGAETYAPKEKQQQIDAFHGSDLNKELKRNSEDYAAFVQLACGVIDSELASKAFVSAIAEYDSDVTLEVAALEIGCEPADITLAIAHANNQGIQAGSRLTGLAHGRPMPRTAWEGEYRKAVEYVRDWKKSEK